MARCDVCHGTFDITHLICDGKYACGDECKDKYLRNNNITENERLTRY